MSRETFAQARKRILGEAFAERMLVVTYSKHGAKRLKFPRIHPSAHTPEWGFELRAQSVHVLPSGYSIASDYREATALELRDLALRFTHFEEPRRYYP